MPVDTPHPLYARRANEWQTLRDCLEGEAAIKAKLDAYLPMTPGQRLDNANAAGNADYRAYLQRADFPDLVRLTLDTCVGLIHRRPATVRLPPALHGLFEGATPDGLDLTGLHRRVTRNVLLTGRHGLLVESSPDGADVPYIADYAAESILNWKDEGGAPTMVVLREDAPAPGRDPFDHSVVPQWRVLSLDAGGYVQQLYRRGESGFDAGPQRQPGRGGRRLDFVPFVFVGAADLTPAPEQAPLMPLARLALRLYQLSADYRQALFLTSQPTPVISGVEPGQEGLPEQIGSDTVWYLPPDSRAFYLEVGGSGIEAHRQAMMDLYDQAQQMGARLLESGRGAESAEALRLRSAAQTVSLADVSRTTAAGLERALKHAARWVGADPEAVRVEPNLDFADSTLSTDAVKDLTDAWQKGAFDHSVLQWNLRRGGRMPEEATEGTGQ